MRYGYLAPGRGARCRPTNDRPTHRGRGGFQPAENSAFLDNFSGDVRQIGDFTTRVGWRYELHFLLAGIVATGLFALAPEAVARGGGSAEEAGFMEGEFFTAGVVSEVFTAEVVSLPFTAGVSEAFTAAFRAF